MTPSVPPSGADGSTSSASVLKNLILTHQWQATVNHIRSNPDDAKEALEFNGVKAHPLHVACAIGAPIGVIKSLIAAYSTATQIKNDSERLPLHCLFLNRCPSLNVLSAIVEAYPAASHIADGSGKLAIHYACDQKGVTDDFFTILLSTYPEGAYVRDSSGKFPINYATSNADVTTKKCALSALDRGTLFASISKMTSARLMEEQHVKMNAIEANHAERVRKMKIQAKEEKVKLMSEVEMLKSQLKQSSDANRVFKEELDLAEAKKTEAVQAAVDNEQAVAAEQERKLRMELAEVQLKNMDLIDKLETVQLDLDNSLALEKRNSAETESTNQRLLQANDTIAMLTQVDQEKCLYITHLEESLLKAQKAVMSLASKQEDMQKAMGVQKEVLNKVLLDHSSTAENIGGLFVDMVTLADDIGCTIKQTE